PAAAQPDGDPARDIARATLRAMVLYTCTDGKSLAALGHPCAKAAKGLDDAGHVYEMKQVKGGALKFWTLPNRARDRAEIEKISGQRAVPILVLDSSEVITGSGSIVSWARENEPQAATPS
ncbi:MAG TPA: glutathione S-transferase N-terminal domain-containing protein, partial [Solirubrobacteraceae bacterium]